MTNNNNKNNNKKKYIPVVYSIPKPAQITSYKNYDFHTSIGLSFYSKCPRIIRGGHTSCLP